MKKNSNLVFSTESGRMCPDCQHPIAECQCKAEKPKEGDGIVRISLDTKGRKGKGVTLIKGLLVSDAELKNYAKKLKQRCSTGGAVKEGVIEIQGDQRALLMELLKKDGHTVKKSGG